MKTSFALIAIGSGIMVYLWAALSTHVLFYSNDKAIVKTTALIGALFILAGALAYLLA